jgi:hypothetical protein
MAAETQTYNGWKNYETWAVKLWLDNDEPTYRYIRRLIREIRVSRPAVYWLADHLFEVVACNAPDLGASMYTYLLHAALDDVDWREIAESFLED